MEKNSRLINKNFAKDITIVEGGQPSGGFSTAGKKGISAYQKLHEVLRDGKDNVWYQFKGCPDKRSAYSVQQSFGAHNGDGTHKGIPSDITRQGYKISTRTEYVEHNNTWTVWVIKVKETPVAPTVTRPLFPLNQNSSDKYRAKHK